MGIVKHLNEVWIASFILFVIPVPNSTAQTIQSLQDFAEASSAYISSCYGIEHLKRRYCSEIAITDNPVSCMNLIESLIPTPYLTSFKETMRAHIGGMKKAGEEGVNKGFQKTMGMTNGDGRRSCEIYGTSALVYNNTIKEEVMRMSRRLK